MVISKRLAYVIGVGALVVMLTAQPWVALGWLVFVFVLSWLDWLLALPPTHLQVRRTLPSALSNHKTATYTLELRNHGSRPARWELRDLWDAAMVLEPDRHRGTTAGAGVCRFTTQLRPKRRGKRETLGFTLRTWGPLRICGRQRTFSQEQYLTVLPEFRFQKHLPAKLAQLRRLAGTNPVRLLAHRGEFESLRDYVPGDDVRDIEWHATGRQGRAVVKTWQPQSGQEVIICVDSSRLGATRLEDYPRLDTHLESALLLGALVSAGQDKASLLTFDARVGREVFSLRGEQILPQFALLLSQTQPVLTEANWPALGARLMQVRTSHALIVICSALESAPSAQLRRTLALLASRHRVIFANTTDPLVSQLAQGNPADPHEIYDVASALQSQQLSAEYVQMLTQCQAKVISAPPQVMPLRLADTYLQMKRDGEL